MGIGSDVLQAGEKDGFEVETEYGCIYSINSGKITFDKTKRNKIEWYRKKIPLLFTWPVLSVSNIKKYKRWIHKNEDNYDAVVAIIAPGDTAIAASEFNNFVLYELDSLINNPEYKRGIKKYYRHRLYRLEKKLYKRASLIIHLNNNKEFYSLRPEYKAYRDKSKYADIPYLVDKHYKHKDNEGQIRAVYLGSLARDYRPPDYLISLLKALSEVIDIRCDFYTRGACEDIIEQAVIDNPGVIYKNDYVPHDVVEKVIEEADMLVSIGNQLSESDYSLPSKTIEYIAAGKPVLHISGGDNDSAIPYYRSYGLACIIAPDAPIEENVAVVTDFLEKNRNHTVPFECVREKFPMNAPEYTASIIRDYICDKG